MQNACEKYIKGIFIKYLDDGFEKCNQPFSVLFFLFIALLKKLPIKIHIFFILKKWPLLPPLMKEATRT